ncbi:hypothetical protein EBT31_00175 [bacterium]|jgi:hypothetical protein|nr:hypothetical protein [bacterium]
MDAIAFIREFGLPTLGLIVAGYAFWQCAAWIARELIVPLRDRHFAFLGSLESTLAVLAKTQQQLGTEIERITDMIQGGQFKPKDKA